MKIVVQDTGQKIVARGYNRHGVFIASVFFPYSFTAIEASNMIARLARMDNPDITSAE